MKLHKNPMSSYQYLNFTIQVSEVMNAIFS